MRSGIRRALATAAAAAVVVVAGGQSPASASTQWSPDIYLVCVDQNCSMLAQGQITWGNRTADVYEEVQNSVVGGIVAVHWDAFAGATKVDSTVTYSSEPVARTEFNLGDPDLPGGIDRIRIQVCSSPTRCSAQLNEIRD